MILSGSSLSAISLGESELSLSPILASINATEDFQDFAAASVNVQIGANIYTIETGQDTAFFGRLLTMANLALAQVDIQIVECGLTDTDPLNINVQADNDNDSSTGGCLLPDNLNDSIDGEELEDFIQNWVSCLTGIDPTLVRPRWQKEPGDRPAITVDWIGVGIIRSEVDAFPATIFHSKNSEFLEFRTHERLELLASFYGPNAGKYSARLRDGMKLSQNREDLFTQNCDVLECKERTHFPELVKEFWYNRWDLPFKLGRQVKRYYKILSIQSAQTQINRLNCN